MPERPRPHRRAARALDLVPVRTLALALALTLFPAPPPLAGMPSALAGEAPGAGAGLVMEPFQDVAFIEARRSGSPVGLYFEADWCAPCREMHARTFVAPGVVAAAEGYRFFRVDMTEPSRAVDLLRESFRVTGAPTVILFDAGGRESGRGFGFIAPEEFQRMLEKGRGSAPPASPSAPPARPAPPALPQA